MREDYGWQIIYRTAVLETDSHRLRALVTQVEDAIHLRLEDDQPLSENESEALNQTIMALAILKTERLLIPLKHENN